MFTGNYLNQMFNTIALISCDCKGSRISEQCMVFLATRRRIGILMNGISTVYPL